MQKTFLRTLAIFATFALTANIAFAAANVLLIPSPVISKAGETFIVAVSVSPQGTKNYSAKIRLNYPSDILEVKSFNFAPGIVPLTQKDYDVIDNEKEIILKTGGFPGGIASTTLFGTISFTAKRNGIGYITVGSDSMILDERSQNVISSAPASTTVAILASTASNMKVQVASAGPEASQTQAILAQSGADMTGTTTATSSNIGGPDRNYEVSDLLGAAATSTPGLFGNRALGVVIGIIILLILIGIVYSISRRRS